MDNIPNEHIWDGTFNIVSPQYIKDNNIKVNCGTKDDAGKKHTCVTCPTGCYHDGKKVVVYEQVK